MWHDITQNTEEWEQLRVGKYTSSQFPKICANMGKAFGNPAKDYARKIALERVTGKKDSTSRFYNSHMQRGHELESEAAYYYGMETMFDVMNGGFYEHNSGLHGGSPDGLIGFNGNMIEIKSVITNTQWDRIEKNNYDTAYKWQIQGNLHLSGGEWCDFISFCPEFKPRPLFIKRVYRDEEMINNLVDRLSQFEELVQKYIKMIS